MLASSEAPWHAPTWQELRAHASGVATAVVPRTRLEPYSYPQPGP